MNALLIDGSYGEGGGQVIRTAVALSAILGRPIDVKSVRAGRPKPGLKAQHLASVKAAAQICCGEVVGAEVGSMEFSMRPGAPVNPGHYEFNIGTAGSTVLVLQTVFLPLVLADGESTVTVTGGTHNPFAPTADYFTQVFLNAMQRAGVQAECSVTQVGFAPGGRGQIDLRVTGGNEIRGLDLSSRGRLKGKSASVTVSEILPLHIGERGRRELTKLADLTTYLHRPETATPGAASHIACEFDAGFAGFVGLGEKGKPIEKVVAESADGYRRLIKSNASVDEHLADQLVLPLAFAKEGSVWGTPTVSQHLRTVVWLVKQFMDVNIAIEEREDGSGIVRVH